jgi:thiamine pyrophosphokinase
MRFIIIAGGQAHEQDGQRWIGDGDFVIGANGGAARALAWGRVPDLVIGDMDSLPDADRTALEAYGCRFVVHPRAKDETDLELALAYAARQGAREIIVLGALGGRLDHLLANVLLLARPELAGVSVRIADNGGEAQLIRNGEAVSLEGEPGDLVSLLPLGGDAQGVTTKGLAWPLRGETLRFALTRGVSNEMTGAAARVEVDRGYLLVVHSPPPNGEIGE